MWKNSKIIGSDQNRGEAGQKRGDADFVMSRTQLVAFGENPRKWLDGEEVKEETKAMTFGSVLDCLTTSPTQFLARFVVAPETYPATPSRKGEAPEQKPWTRQAKFCKEWEAERKAQGLTVVSSEMLADAKLAFTALHANREAASLIECSNKQVLITAEWADDDTGLKIPFSALLDLVPHHSSPTHGKRIADIKTARNGNPARWAGVCDDSGYDVQASLYFDLYRAAMPNEDRTDFIHVIQENVFPFHVVTPMIALSEEFLTWGRTKYKRALRLYAHCLKTGVWPSYEEVGVPFGGTQIIGPEDVWAYRKCAGMTEFRAPEPKPPTAVNDSDDLNV